MCTDGTPHNFVLRPAEGGRGLIRVCLKCNAEG